MANVFRATSRVWVLDATGTPVAAGTPLRIVGIVYNPAGAGGTLTLQDAASNQIYEVTSVSSDTLIDNTVRLWSGGLKVAVITGKAYVQLE